MITESKRNSPRIDITPTWARLNEGLIRVVDYIPDDKLDWSPKPELWNFRGILLHIAASRDGWLGRDVKDGVDAPDVWRTVAIPFREAFPFHFRKITLRANQTWLPGPVYHMHDGRPMSIWVGDWTFLPRPEAPGRR